MKDKFNRYCAEVMGYIKATDGYVQWLCKSDGTKVMTVLSYNPYDDLNQMANVFDVVYRPDIDNYVKFRMTITYKGIKYALRDFIISAMEDK